MGQYSIGPVQTILSYRIAKDGDRLAPALSALPLIKERIDATPMRRTKIHAIIRHKASKPTLQCFFAPAGS